jgi:hypothetical protein
MKNNSFQISACRHCRYYLLEGRRGGQCQQFSAPVHGSWHACPLAMPAFAPSWEVLEPLVSFPGDAALAPQPAVAHRSMSGDYAMPGAIAAAAPVE